MSGQQPTPAPQAPRRVLVVEDEPTMYFGGVGATLANADGTLEAVADPRREGVATVVD